MPSHNALWQRIQQHSPGGQQHQLLLDKLRLSEGWNPTQTRQAVAEYQRFVYLASIAPGPLTPCPAVDQVWHQHLTFSRDYWQVYCPQVLGRPLHHDPAADGDRAQMAQQYQATLALYRREFGEPPAALWGVRQPATAQRPARWPLGVAAALLGATAATARDAAADDDYHGWIAFAAFAIVAYVLWWVFRTPSSRRRRRKDDQSGSSCGSSCSGASCGSSCGGGGD